MLAGIMAALEAFNNAVSIFDRLVTAYEANVKIQWAQSLQAGLQPLEQGLPTTDAQKATAAKAVADAIAKLS